VAAVEADFERALNGVLERAVAGFEALISVERLSGGANQETYRIVIRGPQGERKLAMRRAAGGSADNQSELNVGLETEARLFELAREAGVPAPEIHYLLRPNDGLGDGFIMAWLDGETLGARIVRAPEFAAIRPQLAAQCGRILARIHHIDVRAAGLDKVLNRITPAEFVEQTWARYRALDTPQPMIDFTARWLLQHLPDSSRTTLVHNDFRNGNLMIDAGGIVAVLDWEVAHIGDPMRDLGWLCTHSWRFGCDELAVGGFGEIPDLVEGYEAESGISVDPEALHFWQVFGSFWWAVGTLHMAQHYRTGPDRSVERPAIGRRSSECQADCVNLLIPGQVELLAPVDSSADGDLPEIGELLQSVTDFLHTEVMAVTAGRLKFLSRVAANSLDLVRRDRVLGEPHRRAETDRLRALLDSDEALGELRWHLVNELRAGRFNLDEPELVHHLRTTVMNQLAIDQPGYAALKTAIRNQAE